MKPIPGRKSIFDDDERFRRDIKTDKGLAEALRTFFYERDSVYESCHKCDNGCMGYIGPRISTCDKPPTYKSIVKTDYSTVAGMEDLFYRVYRMKWWEDFWEKKGPLPYSPVVFRKAVIDYINEEFGMFDEVCDWHHEHCNVKDNTKAEDILTFLDE